MSTNPQQRIYTGTACKALDRIAIYDYGYSGLQLMTRAGKAAFAKIKTLYPNAKSLLILCGSGNNGGDGYVVAAEAIKAGWSTLVIAAQPPKTADAQTVATQYASLGGQTVDATTRHSFSIPADLIIDALLGVGLTSAPRGVYAEFIEFANQHNASVFALDVPSGLNADTGEIYPPCIQAEHTMTFIAQKLGLTFDNVQKMTGEIHLETLGLETEIYDQVASVTNEKN